MILAANDYEVDAPESATKSTYIAPKDLRIIAVVVILLIAFMIPIYSGLREGRNKHLCYGNLTQISKAVGLYASQNDDRLPPTYVQDGPSPMLDKEGRPFTWASLVAGNMNKRSSFRCDSADLKELSQSQDASNSKNTLNTAYGMYGVYSGYPIAHIASPDSTALIAETSNLGAMDTYDPVPFIGRDGKPIQQDGFLIGYSDGNGEPSKKTTAVTRLAFPDTKTGTFEFNGRSRHKDGIYYLTVSGSILFAKPPAALIKQTPGEDIRGLWTVPPSAGR